MEGVYIMLTLDATAEELQKKIDKRRNRPIKLDDHQKHVINDIRTLRKNTVSGRDYLSSVVGFSNPRYSTVSLGVTPDGNKILRYNMEDGNLSLLSDSGYGNDSTLKSIIASVATDANNWECVVCDCSHDYQIMDGLKQLNTPGGTTIDEVNEVISYDDGGKYAWLPNLHAMNVTVSDNSAYDLMKVLVELDRRKSILDSRKNDTVRDIREVHGLESLKNILLIVDVGSGFANYQDGGILREIVKKSSSKERVFTIFSGRPLGWRDYKYSEWYSVADMATSTIFNGYIDPKMLSENEYCQPESDTYKIMTHVSRTYRTSLLRSRSGIQAFVTPSLNPDMISKAIQPWCWQAPGTAME